MDHGADRDSGAAPGRAGSCDQRSGRRSGEDLPNKRGIAANELEAIIVATVTPDMFFPATACLVQDKLGAKGTWGFDLSAACSGFPYALQVGAKLVESGAHKKVMVIGAERDEFDD